MAEPTVLLMSGERGGAAADLAITIEPRPEQGATARAAVVTNLGAAPLALAEIAVLAWEPSADERDLSDGALWLHGRQMNTGVFTHRFGRPPERGGFAGQHRGETSDALSYTSAGGVAVLATPRGCRLWGFVTTA